MDSVEEKYLKLKEILLNYKRVAIAFSGGIDSTFLLYAAVDTLGGAKVLAYNCTSVVNSTHSVDNMRRVFHTHFKGVLPLTEVSVSPLTWKEFVSNSDKRCYICKKQMYSLLLDELKKKDCFVLADGTNVDDLKTNRPGLRAIQELEVLTPLVDAGLTKQDIRALSRSKGLVNYDLASNSCLATRITQGVEITSHLLEVVENAETYLHRLGFKGCRVRVDGEAACVQIKKPDFAMFVEDDMRRSVISRFNSLGIKNVSLDLTTR